MVESLAQELGLKLGDQNELTIRRIQARKELSFIRATARRSACRTISVSIRWRCRRPMRGALFPGPASHLQASARCRRPAAVSLSFRLGKVREQRKAHRLARLVAALPKIRRNGLGAPVRRRATANSRWPRSSS